MDQKRVLTRKNRKKDRATIHHSEGELSSAEDLSDAYYFYINSLVFPKMINWNGFIPQFIDTRIDTREQRYIAEENITVIYSSRLLKLCLNVSPWRNTREPCAIS